MTDESHTDDEIASAVVDGLADDHELARVAATPRLAARVEELRSVRAALATAPVADPPSASRREEAIRAAMAAAPPHEVAPTVPVDLAAHRARRRGWVPAAAAAGVAALLGLGAFAVAQSRGDGGGDQVATSTAEDADGGATGAPEQRDVEAAGGAATTAASDTAMAAGPTSTVAAAATSAPLATDRAGEGSPAATTGVPDLGDLDTTEDLAAAVAQLQAEGAVTEQAGADQTSRCGSEPGATEVATLSWAGRAALLLFVDGPPARAMVVDVTDCRPLAEVPLP